MFEKTKKFLKKHEDEVIALSVMATIITSSAVAGGVIATRHSNKGWKIKVADYRVAGDTELLDVQFKNGRVQTLKLVKVDV